MPYGTYPTQQPKPQASAGGGSGLGELGAMLQQLFERMAREEPDAFERIIAENRRAKQDAFKRGDVAGMHDTQLASVNTGRTPWERKQALHAAAGANRERAQREERAERGRINNPIASDAIKADMAKHGRVGRGYVVTGGDGQPFKATTMVGKVKTESGPYESADAAGSEARKKIKEMLQAGAASQIAARLGLYV